jgi:hypothetical protein
MDPLITNGIDPALMRITEKRGHERDDGRPRRRPSAPAKPESGEDDADGELEDPQHALDDLA